jgi:hypothetical protein
VPIFPSKALFFLFLSGSICLYLDGWRNFRQLYGQLIHQLHDILSANFTAHGQSTISRESEIAITSVRSEISSVLSRVEVMEIDALNRRSN